MSFIFAETQGMQSAAASHAGLAADTSTTGTQGHAAGLPVVPPGLDPVSAANCAHIKAFTDQAGSLLGIGAQLQAIYGHSVSNAAGAYIRTDELNATGLGGLV